MTGSEGGWEMGHSPYTPDGSVESASRFGRAGGSPQRRRQIRRFVLLFVLSPIALVLLAVVVGLFTR